MTDIFDQDIADRLEFIRQKNRYRELKIPKGADYSSNDYLSLAHNSELKLKLIEGIELYGAGSTASRLIRGHREIFTTAESIFSDWVGSESSLFVANGYAANVGLISSFGPDTIIFTDRQNHASILDGIRLANADKVYYNHLDMDDLEAKIRKKNRPNKKKIIVTEALFSMDGDIAPLENLILLKEKYDCILLIDEAHSLGVFGQSGNGLACAENLEKKIDIRIFTMGKSMGLEGAMISGKKIVKNYLINSMRSFIFSTAPLPAIAYALVYSIELVKGMEYERKEILKSAQFLRTELIKMGYFTYRSTAQIIPVRATNENEALAMSDYLAENGFDIKAIRPPTVKDSRLRLSVNSTHESEEINNLLEVFKNMQKINQLRSSKCLL